jgi:hypothetical protein
MSRRARLVVDLTSFHLYLEQQFAFRTEGKSAGKPANARGAEILLYTLREKNTETRGSWYRGVLKPETRQREGGEKQGGPGSPGDYHPRD